MKKILVVKMKKIHFIANPFSGNTIVQTLPALVAKYFDKNAFDCTIKHTEYGGHATILAKEAVEAKIDLVVAVGGDGSINEVARGLIGSETILGILPAGSGNGFSMHLGIGRNPERAMTYLKNGAVLEMDTCKVNGVPFVNLAGVGFDANVARRIKGSTLRGFKGYLTYSLKEAVDYQMQDFELEIDGKKIQRKCFSIAVANAPMYGYGFVVAPSAKLNDGLLEVMILKAASKWRYIFEGWRFLNNSLNESSLSERFAAKKVVIRAKKKPLAVHFDGESILVEKGDLVFEIVEKSLKIMCPKDYCSQTK